MNAGERPRPYRQVVRRVHLGPELQLCVLKCEYGLDGMQESQVRVHP